MAFLPDGRRIVSGFANHVGIWDVSQQRLTGLLNGHGVNVSGVSAPSIDTIYSADVEGTLRVWSTNRKDGVRRIETGMISTVGVSRNGQTIVAGDRDGSFTVWRGDDYQAAKLQAVKLQVEEVPLAAGVTRPPGRTVVWLAFPAADGRSTLTMQALAPLGGSIARWFFEPVVRMEPVPFSIDEPGCGQQRYVVLAAVSSDERFLAYIHGRCVVVRDLSIDETVARFAPSGPGQTAARALRLAFHPDGSLLVTTRDIEAPGAAAGASPRQSLLVWDWRADTVRVLASPAAGVLPEVPRWVVSADGSRVAIPHFEPKTVVIWDGALTREISRLPVPLYSMVALSHDGKRLATAVKVDSIVRVWDTQTGQLLLNLADVDTHVGGLEFTADGRLIAGRLGGGITIWETRKPPCPACSPAR